MTSKSRKLNDAISELANTVPYGNLMLCTNPTELILSVIAHIKDIESRLAARDAKSCATCAYRCAFMGKRWQCVLPDGLASICAPNNFAEWQSKEEENG